MCMRARVNKQTTTEKKATASNVYTVHVVLEHGQVKYRGNITYLWMQWKIVKIITAENITCMLDTIAVSLFLAHFGSYSWQLVNVVCSSGPTIYIHIIPLQLIIVFFSISIQCFQLKTAHSISLAFSLNCAYKCKKKHTCLHIYVARNANKKHRSNVAHD